MAVELSMDLKIEEKAIRHFLFN